MLAGDKKLYDEARAAKLGVSRLPPPLEEFRQWVAETYSVKVLHVACGEVENGPGRGIPRLQLVVEAAQDFAAFYTDPRNPFTPDRAMEVAILDKYVEIAGPPCGVGGTTRPGMFLVVDDFSSEAMDRAGARFKEEWGNAVEAEFPDAHIWRVEGLGKRIVIFHQTDQDVVDCGLSGLSERIKARCFGLVKKYDEFDYFRPETFQITFDSKERLDREFEGSLFYYFR